MGLESATYIDGLVTSNPLGDDSFRQGDDHLRLIKAVLQNSFPNIAGAATPSHTELSLLAGLTAEATELNILDGVTISTAELNYLSGVTSAIQTQLDGMQPTSEKGSANGYAGLDSNADVPLANIPDSLVGKDADTLDGEEGSFYQNAANLNAGTLSLARLPTTLTGKTADNATEWGGAAYTVSTTGPSGGNDGDFHFQIEL